MTTRTASLFGNIIDYKTGEVVRQANGSDWQYAREHGDPQTGAHEDVLGETGFVVYCDGPEEMSAEMAQTIYVERFADLGEAMAFEQQVLSAGREFLPESALAVLDGGDATVAYYDFLTEQHAAV